MNVNDAFTTRAIEQLPLTEDETGELVEVVHELMNDAQMDRIPAVEELCAVCFRAGRAYQAGMGYLVPMSTDLLGDFLEYLAGRSQP